MNRRIAVVAALGASLLGVLTACGDGMRVSDPTRGSGAASFVKEGNSDAAQACQQGGWQHLQGSDGTLFNNTGECVSYAAHGGTLVPIPVLPIITSFTFDGTQTTCFPEGGGITQVFFTAVFSNGDGTLTVKNDAGTTVQSVSVTSGQQVSVSQATTYTLTVTNSAGSVSQTLTPFSGGTGGGTGGCSPGIDLRPLTHPGFSATRVPRA